ncbi:MAG: hypothetical protein IPI81_04940 [Flavobacteriales bacterium]|nr:hypothetical protein [Flavobacteriales bacterium]MCC6939838.1 hypothetical protein [Flavobacteriales bacterium]
MDIDQHKPALFYFLAVDARIKFGITSDWDKRFKRYQKDLGEFAVRPFKTENYHHRWQAELVEQVLKWRLWDFITHDEHEWVESLPIDTILHVYRDTRDQLRPEFEKHRHIHTRPDDRWGHYKQIAAYQFKGALE